MTTPVTLTFHMTQELVKELTLNGSGNGVYAYLWNNQPVSPGTSTTGFVSTTSSAASPSTNYFTALVLDGVQQGGALNGTTNTYDYVVQLTDDSVANPVSGGKVYLIIQSDPLTGGAPHVDLTSAAAIGNTEGAINATNAAAWNFGYDTFEVALQNSSADVADLSSINSFGHQLGVSVVYEDGTVGARGYSPTYSAYDFAGLISTTSVAVGGVDANYPYPTGSTGALWDNGSNAGMIAITPATTQALPAGSTLPNAWTPADWAQYVTAVGQMGDVRIVGYFNGAKDAAGVYHNAGYYAYSVALKSLAAGGYGAAGDYFVLTPDASSQIKGAIVISTQNLANNLWSPGLSGTDTAAYIYTDATLSTPFDIDGSAANGEMNTGANNQWGTVFTQFFTGFSGGYYGGVGTGIPAVEGSTILGSQSINLNHNWNWDPTYAFDGGRSNTPPGYQHYDPYAKLYFDNTNVYGGAYSDALTGAFTTSVLLPVWSKPGSTSGQNVSNIDLWGFGVAETMTNVPGTTTPFYTPNTIDNYIAPATGKTDYDLGSAPPPPAAGDSPVFGPSNVTINLANNGMVVDPAKAEIKLGIYLGNGQFQYVALPTGAAQNGGGFWQQWMITEDSTQPAGSQFAISSIPIPANPAAGNPGSPYTPGSFGSLSFASFPTAADATLVYRLLVGDKTFTFYATTDSSGNFVDVATDGLGVITLAPTVKNTFTLSIIPGTMNALGSDVMVPNTDASYIDALPPGKLTAPVAGTLSGAGVFQALTGNGNQSAPYDSTLTLDAVTPLYFGWTGLSDAAGVPSWISAATNKIMAGDIAEIAIQKAGLLGHAIVRAPAADIDGQWQTTRAMQLGVSGTYTVTVTERLPDGTVYGLPSSPLTITVNLATKKESGTVIGNYTAAEIADLSAQGIDVLDATNGHVMLSLAQALALGPVVLARGDMVTLSDSGAAIAALTPDALRGLEWRNVDVIDATDDRLVLDVAQFQALGRIALTAADLVVLADDGAALSAIPPGRMAWLAGRGIDMVDSTDDVLRLTAKQALALVQEGIQIAPEDVVILTDSAARLASLGPAELAGLASLGIDAIEPLGTLGLGPAKSVAFSDFARKVADPAYGMLTSTVPTLHTGSAPRKEIDIAIIRADTEGGIVVLDGTLVDVASMRFEEDFLYTAGTIDGAVAAGAAWTVDASSLGAGGKLIFDGSAERDGTFHLRGGAGAVSFIGGRGADLMEAGSGAELFRYTAARQSTGSSYDTIDGFDAALDRFEIWSGVSAVEAPIVTGTLNILGFAAGLEANLAGLGPRHAVLFMADAGTLAGVQFLAIDTNGVAGYQSGEDLVIRLENPLNLGGFGLGDFA